MEALSVDHNMLDWTRVKTLREEIGEADFLEVVELFLDETDEVVAQLPENADPKAVESKLHFLKGSALNLGFASLAVLCQAGERSAASGNSSLINLAEVAANYKSSKEQLLVALGGPSAS